MTDREVIELIKDAAVYADARWIPCRERLLEASSRYLLLIKNDYERRYSKTAWFKGDVTARRSFSEAYMGGRIMSYFPCDIPFMSDEELKENGINIPKKRITNREKLARMSNQKLAEYMCVFTDCYKCVGQTLCVPNGAKANGVKKWLESEAEEDNVKD